MGVTVAPGVGLHGLAALAVCAHPVPDWLPQPAVGAAAVGRGLPHLPAQRAADHAQPRLVAGPATARLSAVLLTLRLVDAAHEVNKCTPEQPSDLT